MKPFVGIDLGTTNTVAAVANIAEDGNVYPRVIDIQQLSDDFITQVYDKLLPSSLYIDRYGNKYVGKIAKVMKTKEHDRVIYNSKNYIGNHNYFWEIDNLEYSPEDVASLILKMVKKNIEREINEDIKGAVITVPASFNHDQIQSTKNAAKMAGFDEDETYFISEPTAALLDFINSEKSMAEKCRKLDFKKSRKMLVFDLGGGTCDISIMNVKINDTEFKVEEIAISPHTQLGGVNFDLRAVIYLLDRYAKEIGSDFDNLFKDEDEKRYIISILSAEIENARMQFAVQSDMEINSTFDSDIKYSSFIPNFVGGKPYFFIISKKEYDDCIEPLLMPNSNMGYNIIDPILDTLNKANLTIDDIDDVFLVGGMTLYQPVQKAVEKLFRKKPIISLDPMYSVAKGAAIYHYFYETIYKNGNKSNETIIIDPVVADNIYIDVENGFPFLLVAQGTRAPYEKIYDGILKVNNATGMKLDIFSGKSLWDPKMKRLKSAQLSFSNIIKPGTPISLKVEFDKNRILNLSAWVANSIEQKLSVTIGESRDTYGN